MTQQVQELIDKIKFEGIEAAEKKTKEIEQHAQERVNKIVQEAQKQAERMKIDAKEENKRLTESTHMALKQAARDTILSLRKEIDNLLKRVTTQEVGEALKTENLTHIISEAVKGVQSGADVLVTLNPKDLEKLKGTLIGKLQKEMKGKLNFQASSDISSGFMISYDSGKSSFDFTDESLANYLSSFLSAQVAELVKTR